MPTYAELNQRNPGFNEAEHQLLNALYAGGTKMRCLLKDLLPKRPHEPDDRYTIRKNEAEYRNYVGPIVDYFTAMLFATQPTMAAKKKSTDEIETEPDKYYSKLQDDCDGNGRDLSALFKAQLTDAMVSGYSWVRVSSPDDGGLEPVSKAEFEDRKLGACRVTALNCDAVLDWEADEDGKLEFAVVHSRSAKRTSLSAGRGTITETWEVLYRDSVEVYSVTYEEKDPPKPEKEIPLKAKVKHRFGRVPLICIDLPVALRVASRLETPQLAHFRKTNALAWSLSATCYAQPVFTLMDRASMPTMGAGLGLMLGKDETVTYLSPPTEHFDALATEIKSEKDEIFRVAHQMALGVENNAAAVGRSGESKQQDAQSTRVALLAYSRIVKEAIEICLDLVSACRGDDLVWAVDGLDDFAAADISGLLDVLEKVEKVGGIPSKTFNTQVKTRVAEALLPDLDQASKQAMRDEIDAGVEKQEQEESELAQMTKDLKLQSQQVVPPGTKPGAVPPPPPGKPGGNKKPPFPPKK